MSSHTVLARCMIEKLIFDTVLFRLIGGVSAKTGQKSENMDTGCLEY